MFTYAILLIVFIVPSTYMQSFTLMDTQESQVRLNPNTWKPDQKLHFKIQTNGEDGIIFTIISNDNAKLSLRVTNKQFSLNVQGKNHNIPGITDKIINRETWYEILLEETGLNLKLQVNDVIALLPLIRNRKWLVVNWKDVIFGKDFQVEQDLKNTKSILGCVELTTNHNGSIINEYALETQSILTTCVDACAIQICENNGKCINYFNHGFCDCRKTGFKGSTCEEETQAVQLNGDNYLKIEKVISLQEILSNEISVRFKTSEKNGILMVQLKQNDQLTVELYNGSLYVTSMLDGVYFQMNIGDDLHDNQWHFFEITRSRNQLETKLDDIMDIQALINNINDYTVVYPTKEKLLVQFGGTDDSINMPSHLLSKTFFQGCLQQVYFDNEDIIEKVFHGNNLEYTSRLHLNTCK